MAGPSLNGTGKVAKNSNNSFLFTATCSRLTPSSYECNRTLISPNEGREANAKVRLNFNICTSITLIADVTVQIEGFKNVYNGHLVGEHHFTIHDNDFRHNFTLGGPKVDPNKGYLPLDGGEISLFVKEDEKKNVFHVMVSTFQVKQKNKTCFARLVVSIQLISKFIPTSTLKEESVCGFCGY